MRDYDKLPIAYVSGIFCSSRIVSDVIAGLSLTEDILHKDEEAHNDIV